jgi:hypothetical protein
MERAPLDSLEYESTYLELRPEGERARATTEPPPSSGQRRGERAPTRTAGISGAANHVCARTAGSKDARMARLIALLNLRVHGRSISRRRPRRCPEAGEGALTTCGSERHSNQYANPPNTIDPSHEKSSPSVARAIGPRNSETPPYSKAQPPTNPTSSAKSERQRMSP